MAKITPPTPNARKHAFENPTGPGHYTVYLEWNGRMHKFAPHCTAPDYWLYAPDGTLLFSGHDVGLQAVHHGTGRAWNGFYREHGGRGAYVEPTGRFAALQVLFMATLQPGDTDPEYFDDYTPEQLAWANSYACEALGDMVETWEEKLTPRQVEE